MGEVLISEAGDVELEGLRQGKEHISSLIIDLLCKKEAATARIGRKPLRLLHLGCWKLLERKPEEREP